MSGHRRLPHGWSRPLLCTDATPCGEHDLRWHAPRQCMEVKIIWPNTSAVRFFLREHFYSTSMMQQYRHGFIYINLHSNVNRGLSRNWTAVSNVMLCVCRFDLTYLQWDWKFIKACGAKYMNIYLHGHIRTHVEGNMFSCFPVSPSNDDSMCAQMKAAHTVTTKTNHSPNGDRQADRSESLSGHGLHLVSGLAEGRILYVARSGNDQSHSRSAFRKGRCPMGFGNGDDTIENRMLVNRSIYLSLFLCVRLEWMLFVY